MEIKKLMREITESTLKDYAIEIGTRLLQEKFEEFEKDLLNSDFEEKNISVIFYKISILINWEIRENLHDYIRKLFYSSGKNKIDDIIININYELIKQYMENIYLDEFSRYELRYIFREKEKELFKKLIIDKHGVYLNQ